MSGRRAPGGRGHGIAGTGFRHHFRNRIFQEIRHRVYRGSDEEPVCRTHIYHAVRCGAEESGSTEAECDQAEC